MADENTPAEGAQDEAAKAAAEKAAAENAAASEKAEPDEELLKGARDPDAVRNAIKAEREAAKAAKKAAEEAQSALEAERAKVKEFEDRDKSEEEKREERAKEAEKKAAMAEGKLLRLTVAARKKLPLDLAPRLQGETEAELEADAENLLKLVKAEDTVSLDGGARKSTRTPDDMNARIRAAAGR